jgi:hypothetical protein
MRGRTIACFLVLGCLDCKLDPLEPYCNDDELTGVASTVDMDSNDSGASSETSGSETSSSETSGSETSSSEGGSTCDGILPKYACIDDFTQIEFIDSPGCEQIHEFPCPEGQQCAGGQCLCYNECDDGNQVISSCTGEVVAPCSWKCEAGTCIELECSWSITCEGEVLKATNDCGQPDLPIFMCANGCLDEDECDCENKEAAKGCAAENDMFLYWYDSCGVKQDAAEFCALGCSASTHECKIG